MGMMNEFKEFAAKGNVVDMAVGFILGGAFSTIVKSLVSDIIMPPIGLLIGGVDFENLKWTLKAAEMDGETVVTEAVTMNIGLFINNVISFLIVALALFFLVKGINTLKRRMEGEPEPEAPAETPPPPREQVLLEEIRDLLKK
ncbi:MAG: large conductance mechanosensitive channel protein MscL [Ponticaulis sp.]|nr:large conductance mechanosensitive channel protein MscL [Ponticaulis sp.]|tara:strand:- start:1341 stop:1769 length:429 start_codon:yes stop_codon:yes gene_type:complete